MSIKSDKWITKQSIDGGMICPFFHKQIKEVKGNKVLSYGVSSYGYDVRCADEFKLFTNINSTLVDPKDFDEKNFVDIKGEYCIIPPNSFALARTVEHFKIPRDVLVVCLGKSTYARCFTKDTKVKLVDGTSPDFEELVSRYNSGEKEFYGYGWDGEKYVAQILTQPRVLGKEEIYEVELDNKEVIRCTGDHEFFLRDGSKKQAKELSSGESLLPHGYENIHLPVLVVEVRRMDYEEEVFCLSAEVENFALDSGVIVSNCGIIVNVTPLEPEWEGYVTLEFSNTTPLPAKIYANEGVAQMLFFQADSDDICEVSYFDRGGKYQGQTGVVIPRV